MIGAHWFTDIAVGSLTAVSLASPVLMTPLSDTLIAWFNRSLPGGVGKINLFPYILLTISIRDRFSVPFLFVHLLSPASSPPVTLIILQMK